MFDGPITSFPGIEKLQRVIVCLLSFFVVCGAVKMQTEALEVAARRSEAVLGWSEFEMFLLGGIGLFTAATGLLCSVSRQPTHPTRSLSTDMSQGLRPEAEKSIRRRRRALIASKSRVSFLRSCTSTVLRSVASSSHVRCQLSASSRCHCCKARSLHTTPIQFSADSHSTTTQGTRAS